MRAAGPGLCGPLIAPYAARLVGVDLSGGMLAHAREKAVYHALVQEELSEFLRDNVGAFDLIVSADTLVYFGALDEVFGRAAAALRPNGLLVCTLERLGVGGDALDIASKCTDATATPSRMSSACSPARGCAPRLRTPSCDWRLEPGCRPRGHGTQA
jgi:SAM-dependent methyltransferase